MTAIGVQLSGNMHMSESIEQRKQFFADIEAGKLSMRDILRGMRKIAGMTQVEYAKLIGVAPRIIIDLERGVGNPTLKTLEKIGKPFGLGVTFRHK